MYSIGDMQKSKLGNVADNMTPLGTFSAPFQHYIAINTGVSSEFITKQNADKMQMTSNDMLARSHNKEAGQALSNLCVVNRPTIIFF